MAHNDISKNNRPEPDYTAGFLKNALNSAASGIIITDNNGIIQYANPAFLKIFRYDRTKEIIGENAAGLFVSDRIREFADVRCIVEQGNGQTGEAAVEYKDGTVFPVEVSFSEARDNQDRIIGKMASFIDISKRIQAEKQLRASEEKLRVISRKIIETQENERKRVALELHDSVGGNLAAIKFALEQKLASSNNGSADDAISLDMIVENIKDTIVEVRRMSNHLMPSVLVNLGLVEAIRWFCREQKKYYQNARIITRLEVEEDKINDLFKITIFRVVQEALSNAFKHGEADTIRLDLIETEDHVELCIADNGCGFDRENDQSNPDLLTGFGLQGMNDRAEVCDGTCEISSEIGKGTQVKLRLPYR